LTYPAGVELVCEDSYTDIVMSDLKALADRVAGDWTEGPYYDEAEREIERQWADLIWPLIQGSDFSVSLDLGAGHGRNTEMLLGVADRVIAVDVNRSNVDFLRQRFAGNSRVQVIQNNGFDLADVPIESVTFIYSFDSMVHFDRAVVRAYVKEFRRIMKAGARGFTHYSNNHADPDADYREHPGWRNYMSRELFNRWLNKEGLEVLLSGYIEEVKRCVAEESPNCDAFTVFRMPANP
jgi:SAM-dependent methyltransferase